jgi:hypothetical protein
VTEQRFQEIRAGILAASKQTGVDREAALLALAERYGRADVLAAADVMEALHTVTQHLRRA